jgi:glycosyltransferase involved in cell wall biosynthesis
MHVLLTADTLGGVWTYTRELVTGLVNRGVKVTLVSFGGMPSTGQTLWMEQLPAVAYHPTAFKLEWMQDSHADLDASSAYLQAIIHQTKPEVLHFSQFYYGGIDCDVPRIVVAHSDVVSWWVAVHGQEPPQTSWMTWYRNMVARGLAGATAVIAPSQWMLDQVQRYYPRPARALVIHNGRTPQLFNPDGRKELKILTAGRLWDQGKNAGLMLAAEMPARVQIAGVGRDPGTPADGFVTAKAGANVDLLGPQDEDEMVRILSSAAIYVAPSRYEPFGLTPVEAALSRCALVLSDIPSLRELWEGAAVFFRNNDAHDLKQALDRLICEPHLREEYGDLGRNHALLRFQAARMIDGYLEIYKTLASTVAVAA